MYRIQLVKSGNTCEDCIFWCNNRKGCIIPKHRNCVVEHYGEEKEYFKYVQVEVNKWIFTKNY